MQQASPTEAEDTLLAPSPSTTERKHGSPSGFARPSGPASALTNGATVVEHAEAVVRLEALWRAWELLPPGLDPALGMATWLDYSSRHWTCHRPQRPPARCEPTCTISHPAFDELAPVPSVRTEVS